MTTRTTTPRTPKPAFELGLWQADRTAPVLLDGQEVGRLVRLFDWYDLRFASGLSWAGGKKISKALDTFAYVWRTRPDARPADPRSASERAQDADWADEQDTIASLRASL
jgi:hypothetical protein